MADVRKFWPVVVYAFALWGNTDLIIPMGLAVVGPSVGLAAFVVVLATLELSYSFWFWGWVVKQGPAIQRLRDSRRPIVRKGLFSNVLHGLINWVLDGVLAGYRKVTNPANGFRKSIERWGIPAVWVAGINPIPGLPTRGPCSIFLGFYGLRREFVHLLMANIIHVLLVIWSWKQVLG